MTLTSRRKFLGMSAAAAAATALTPLAPRIVEASTAHRGFITGMLARRHQDLNAITAPFLTGLVVELPWNVAQTESRGNITTAARNLLQEGLDLSTRTGKNQLKLRIFAGSATPSFALSSGGRSLREWVDGQSGLEYTVPRWWRTEYLNAYEDFIQRLAPLLTDRRWREVTISGPMTVFVEPCIRQFGSDENRDQLQSVLQNSNPPVSPAQFNTLNRQAVERAIEIHRTHFSSRGIISSLAYNPWELLNSNFGYAIDLKTMVDLMDRQKERLGNLGIWQNNSLQAQEDKTGAIVQLRTADGYPEMYEKMGSRTWYSQYQTATVARIHAAGGTVYDTVRYVVQNGGLSVEMPTNWWLAQWDTEQFRGARLKREAATLNAAMLNNLTSFKP